MVPSSAVDRVRTRSATDTRPRSDAQDAGEENDLQRSRKPSPLLVPLEQRPPPEHAEQDERDHEHDRRGREEEGLGNREVAHASDPVGERHHGWTVRSAI